MGHKNESYIIISQLQHDVKITQGGKLKMTKQNKPHFVGNVATKPEINHKIFGESFYMFQLSVERASGTCDVFPVMVSDRVITTEKIESLEEGMTVEIKGEMRSRKVKSKEKKLQLHVMAESIEVTPNKKPFNNVFLIGELVSDAKHRKLTNRKDGREDTDVTDIFLRVHRSYNKHDYIPVILWGKNARYAASLKKGTNVSLDGRLQSRGYTNRTTGNVIAIYELSASRIEVNGFPEEKEKENEVDETAPEVQSKEERPVTESDSGDSAV